MSRFLTIVAACAFIGIALTFDASSGQDATQAANTAEDAIQKLLDDQIRAWNAGDLDGFMAYYWKNDGLTFSSGGKTTRSWQATLDRYKQRYPTKAAMGTTTFKNLEITPLGDAAAMVLGEWQLRRDSGETIGGNFTLVLRKIDGKWVIIHDHTSQLPAA